MSACLSGLKEHLGEALTENLTGLLQEGAGISPASLVTKALGKFQALGEIQSVLGAGILPMKQGYGLPLGRMEGGTLGDLASLKAKAEGLMNQATEILAKVAEYQALFPGCGADGPLGDLVDGLQGIHENIQSLGFGDLDLGELAAQSGTVQQGVDAVSNLLGISTEALDRLSECGS